MNRAQALRALATPKRRAIVKLVWDRELSSSEVAAKFGDATWQGISHNLRVLKEAGLISERREGRRRLYCADSESLGPLTELLEQMWLDDLESLGRVVGEDEA